MIIIKTRYLFLKRLYPNYVIIILKKDEYITFDIDNKIVKLIDYKLDKYLEIKMRVELISLLFLVSKIYQKHLDIKHLL